MSAIAIIPARAGSKGIAGKNIRPLSGIPLVGRSVMAAVRAASISRVFISSDSEEILEIGAAYGAKPIHRPAEISGDTASTESALVHALDFIRPPEETLVLLQCTSPFTTSRTIDAVARPVLSGEFDSSFSAKRDHSFLWHVAEDGSGVGVNHDHRGQRQRRQDLPPTFRETGAVYAMNVDRFAAERSRFCGKVTPVPVEGVCLEVDSDEDWKHAEAIAAFFEERSMRPSGSLSHIRMIVMDFDGVHTDDRVIVSETGEESVVCHRGDGMAIERLRNAGYQLLILSKEINTVVQRRADKLHVEVVHGVRDKVSLFEERLLTMDLGWNRVAYIGNDVNDIGCMERAGVSFAPNNAAPVVKDIADVVLPANGGEGAIREMSKYFLTPT